MMDGKQRTIVLLFLLMTIGICITSLIHRHYKIKELRIKEGYEEVHVPVTYYEKVWQKRK